MKPVRNPYIPKQRIYSDYKSLFSSLRITFGSFLLAVVIHLWERIKKPQPIN